MKQVKWLKASSWSPSLSESAFLVRGVSFSLGHKWLVLPLLLLPLTLAWKLVARPAERAAPNDRDLQARVGGFLNRQHFLVVLERTDSVTWLSLRNAPQVHIVAVDQLNTYDVLASDDVVFTQGAYDAFVKRVRG